MEYIGISLAICALAGFTVAYGYKFAQEFEKIAAELKRHNDREDAKIEPPTNADTG